MAADDKVTKSLGIWVHGLSGGFVYIVSKQLAETPLFKLLE